MGAAVFIATTTNITTRALVAMIKPSLTLLISDFYVTQAHRVPALQTVCAHAAMFLKQGWR